MDIRVPIEPDNPSICRDEAKCIKCGQCKKVCTESIGVAGRYDLSLTGDNAICIHCGQCANVCLPEALRKDMSMNASGKPRPIRTALLFSVLPPPSVRRWERNSGWRTEALSRVRWWRC
ncbi:MAG: hypothetical protein ACLUOI_01610 [Eisenbergiella sp.]